MILNQEHKIEHAIAFFADKYHSARGSWPTQMWIYKLLALLDFRILMATGRPCLGMHYLAMEKGPVPQELYNNRYAGMRSEVFRFVPVYGSRRITVEALQKPNLDYFSDRAIEEMEKLSDEFIYSDKELNDVINETHNLRSWSEAWKAANDCGRRSMLMEYVDEFPADPTQKKPEELSFQEEAFCIYEKRREAEAAEWNS